MIKQDIYGTIGDDIAGQRGATSTMKGAVRAVDVWINTQKIGDARLKFVYDKDKKKVIVRGTLPSDWDFKIKKIKLKDVI